MEDDKGVSFGGKRRSNGRLIGIFVALVMVIVGLGTAVTVGFVMRKDDAPDDLSEDAIAQNDAFNTASVINHRYLTEPGYSYQDAIVDYENSLMSQGDDWYKFSSACYYARFVLEYGLDLDSALEIMDMASEFIDENNNDMVIEYYVVLRDLNKGLNQDLYDFYNEKIITLTAVEEVNDVGFPVDE